MSEGWKGKAEPFTMNQQELSELSAEIAKQKEAQQKTPGTGSHAEAVRERQKAATSGRQL
ncbi:MAG: hypothetical protein KGP29_00120 [Proteobacteria bacterium]|nr:hypothetical protein [Pseudomonadota bacterium]